MQTAGYVLAGGASSRMGTNKAFLTLAGRTLLEIAAEAVLQAAGSVTVIGSPDLYARFGYPVVPDSRDHAGPLAGIETALSHTTAAWNLVVACDMPRANPETLRRILGEALKLSDEALCLGPQAVDIGCILPESSQGFVEPLCAAYHKRMLAAITSALDLGTRKVSAALPRTQVHYLRMTGDPMFQNVNTPEEWRLAQDRQ